MQFIIVYCAICSAHQCERRVRKMEERGDQGDRNLAESFCLALCACWLFSGPAATNCSSAMLHRKHTGLQKCQGRLVQPPVCPRNSNVCILLLLFTSDNHTSQLPRSN